MTKDNKETKCLELLKDAAKIIDTCEAKIDELRELIKAKDEALELGEKHLMFDCPHESEQQCKCATVERELWNKYRKAVEQALSLKEESEESK